MRPVQLRLLQVGAHASTAPTTPDNHPPSPAKEAPGPDLLQILILAAVLAGGWGAWKWIAKKPAPNEAQALAVLNPAPYKKELTALESILYKDTLPMMEDKQALVTAVERLIRRIPASNHPGPVATLHEFSSYLSSYDSGLVLPPTARDEWIRKWEEARGVAFSEAAWLRAPAAPQAAAAGAEGMMDPQEALLALQRSAAALAKLMAAAEKETAKFGETRVDRNDAGAADKKQLGAWRNWVADWLVRVDGVTGDIPSPSRLPVEVQEGGLLLHRITVDLRAVPDPGAADGGNDADIYLPDKAARDGWLSAAGERLKQAEAALQKAAAPAN
jgi:hypothetical protein